MPTDGHAALGITGYGLACSLGVHAPTACAAARAGISRTGPLDFEVLDEGELVEESVSGHPAGDVTRGFARGGRLIQLGSAALHDFLGSVRVATTTRSALYVLFNDGYYRKARLHREISMPDYAGDAREDADDLVEDDGLRRSEIERHVLPAVVTNAGMHPGPGGVRVFFGGPARFVELLREATAALTERRHDQVVVGAIDCLVETEQLEDLSYLRLLKSSESPAGLAPGEAASFLGLVSGDTFGGRTGSGVARVSTIHTDHAWSGAVPPQGRALAAAIEAVLSEYPSPAGRMSFNLNGSVYRATDLGQALVHLAGRGFPVSVSYDVPLTSFGEVGVAAGPAMACLAAHRADRGMTDGPVVIGLASDDGERSAFLMDRR